MGIEFILIFEKVVPALAIHVAKLGYQKLIEHPPVSKAIEKTSDAFNDTAIENVKESLKKWCRSQRFADLLTEF
ncbi:MAG: hypothetical protein OEW87_10880, partial [Flavobacteriaceae bacterium]|nr:hypothetical protein [Flavobacteriaceae bacterium]